jgi:hypothetical protein
MAARQGTTHSRNSGNETAEMTAARTFKVGVYGVKPMEVGMLDRAFRLSQFRPRVYRLLDGEREAHRGGHADLRGGAPKVIGNIPLVSITDKENPAAGCL